MKKDAIQDLGLPVLDISEDMLRILEDQEELVLEAPPGAGKTTLVPLLLKDCHCLRGRKILMLEPRRVAARAAAHRMAELLGEKIGQTVGYRVRQDVKVSGVTRIEVITEGILTRMLQSDPALDEVGLLIFDEFHERSVDSDLGLALAMQGRELFRETPLKILIMSATLDGDAVSNLLGGAPVLRSEGRQYPVEVHYGRSLPWGASVIQPVLETLGPILASESAGSVLVFLPGQAEIRRVMAALGSPSGVDVLPLHGSLELAQQERAIRPGEAGRRKIVLATNIAETSLTIDGINTVVDSGLARQPAYDPGTGMTRLQTRRISRASAEQRAGRAGRLGPGHCYRIWSEEQQQQLAPRTEPEMIQSDLTPLMLQLLAWGVDDPAELNWLDTPPAGACAQALELLQSWDLFESRGAVSRVLNERGMELARLPLHPRLGQMLLFARERGMSGLGCELAAILSEGRLPDTGTDVLAALALLRSGSGSGRDRGWISRVGRQARQLRRMTGPEGAAPAEVVPGSGDGLLLAAAYPDRIARQKKPGAYQLANGRYASLPLEDGLAREEWLVVTDSGGRGGRSDDRIFAAVPFDPVLLEHELAHLVSTVDRCAWDDVRDCFVAERCRNLGSLQLSAKPLDGVSDSARVKAVLDMIRRRGLERLPWNPSSRQWCQRVRLLHATLGSPWPDTSDEALLAGLDDWLGPWLGQVRRPADLQRLDLQSILSGLLPWPLPRELDVLAPQKIRVPSGSGVGIDYSCSPPVLAVKLQEMFGSEETPAVVGGKVPLLLQLLSPARRPLQVTQDLAAFWRNAYAEVRKEMKGRYPKHPWPEDPLQALPTRHTRHRR